ncbi:MAG: hypothetical protein SOY23_09360 [Prevotella sp.]|nr:hypothetical protein [Prevotella sp.]
MSTSQPLTPTTSTTYLNISPSQHLTISTTYLNISPSQHLNTL